MVCNWTVSAKYTVEIRQFMITSPELWLLNLARTKVYDTLGFRELINLLQVSQLILSKTSITCASINSESQHYQLSNVTLHETVDLTAPKTSTEEGCQSAASRSIFINLQHTWLNTLHFSPSIISPNKLANMSRLLAHDKSYYW
jgi:hypothetical protein